MRAGSTGGRERTSSFFLSSTATTEGSKFADYTPSGNRFRRSPGHNPQDQFLFPPVSQTGCETTKINERMPQPTLESRPAHSKLKKIVPPSPSTGQCSSEGRVGDDGFSIKAAENHDVKLRKPYVPPRLRTLSSQEKNDGLRSLEEREATEQKKHSSGSSGAFPDSSRAPSYLDLLNSLEESDVLLQRGGCADPKLVTGSIMDSVNIPRGASKLPKSRSEAFGSLGGKFMNGDRDGMTHSWETGAVSECGIRDSNEDAYLIVDDLREACLSASPGESPNAEDIIFRNPMGLFAIFDGHSGNQAARYAAENLIFFLQEELRVHISLSEDATEDRQPSFLYRRNIEFALRDALKKLDDEFCRICQEGGRDWESGSTAIVAMIVDKWLVIANLGDCRGVVCRSVDEGSSLAEEGWNELYCGTGNSGVTSKLEGEAGKRHFVWQEVSNVHKPSNENEKARIERANGWITTETEIPIGQLRRMDFLDEDFIDILRKCFSDRYENAGSAIRECKAAPQRILEISRVCGELAVSRALGDRDFKAAFHIKGDPDPDDKDEHSLWDSPLDLTYPEEHTGLFVGNLVDNSPDFQQIQIGDQGSSEEFILLASDGLWDVLDVDDAARVTRDLLFRRQWTAKRTAARLAELAIHLGSSDNVTVIVVRVMDCVGKVHRSAMHGS